MVNIIEVIVTVAIVVIIFGCGYVLISTIESQSETDDESQLIVDNETQLKTNNELQSSDLGLIVIIFVVFLIILFYLLFKLLF